jgi:colanic acid/amylovoran biosynthesis protein
MIIEVSGVGFRNMGASLMLAAARQALCSWDIVDGVALNALVGTRKQRQTAGCSDILRLDIYSLRWLSPALDTGLRFVPAATLRAMGAHRAADIDALFDASGFAFGDQHGALAARKKARLFASYALAGKPVVLLPQAFGPFAKREVAEAAKNALDHTDLIFARDQESLGQVRSLGLTKPNVHLAPDFTNLIEPPIERLPHRTVVVIPNGRMTQMVDTVTRNSYLRFLRTCTATALESGFRVVVLAHEPMDYEFAEKLHRDFREGVTCRSSGDPVRIKAFVGGAQLVISSRFHGLANALSQCVPAIGTSWSHKYQHLFADYDCEDGLWPVDDPSSTSRRLASWLDDDALDARRAALGEPARTLKDEARAMWSTVQARLAR